MQTRIILGFALSGLLVASTASARDELSSTANEWRGTAPTKAFELTWGSGFSHAFGSYAKDGSSLGDVANSGGALQLGLGYRLSPQLMLGVYGEGGSYRPDQGSLEDKRNFSGAAGVVAQWHFTPFARWDPWLGVGTGWRGYWAVDDDAGTSTLQGMDIVRLQAGVDYHLNRSLTVSPLVGVSISEFLMQRKATQSSFHEVNDPRPTTFLFVGTAGRFDFGGKFVAPKTAVASR